METYDYVVVGAGSAGCVLGNRLSANPNRSVAVIEAGPDDDSLLIDMPRGLARLYEPGSPYISNYEVQRGNRQGIDNWMKGRCIGGSNSVDGMVYSRGVRQDYDDWEAAGCTGWGWRHIGEAYKAIEGHALAQAAWRGADGPLKVSTHNRRTELTEALIRAAEQAGVKRVSDLNNAPNGGVGYQPGTIYRGRRMSAARAFLHPARKRRNLTVKPNTKVLRVLFDRTRAVALEVQDRAGVARIGIGREVILSAGALETPKLLQLSGVGPGRRLQRLGIDIVTDHPNVGGNLRDHVNLNLKYHLSHGSFRHEFSGPRLLLNVLLFLLAHRGPMSFAAHEVGAFVKTRARL